MRADLLWRAALPLAALGALLGDAPPAVAGGLALVSLVAAIERLVRLRGLGLTDRVLVGTGGLTVVLVLSGMLMGSTAIGLGATSWTVALVVLSLAGLAVAAIVPPRPDPGDRGAGDRGATRRTTWRLLPWVVAVGLVVAVSTHLTADSQRAAEAPPLEMSFGRVSGTQVEVVVSSSDAVGPLEVRTSGNGDEISYPLFSVPADGSSSTTVSLPREGRYEVTLNYPAQAQPLRTLVLDR